MQESSTSNSSKNLLIALRELSADEQEALRQRLEEKSFDYQFVNDVDFALSKARKVQKIDTDKLYKESYEDAFDSVVSFGELQLDNGKTLAEQLKGADGKSLWYYFRFMTLYRFRLKLYEERLFNALEHLRNEYDSISVFHTSSSLDKRLNKAGFESYCDRKKSQSKLFSNSVRFLFITLSRFLIGLTQFPRLMQSKKHVLLVNAQPNQKIIDSKSFDEVWGDHFTEYLQDRISQEKDILALTELFPPNLKSEKLISISSAILFGRYKGGLNLELVLYLQFLNPWFYVRSIKAILKVKKAFAGLSIASPSTEERILFSILPAFKRMSYFLAIRKAGLRWLFKMKNYRTIGGANEHDPRVKSILETASHAAVKTYGIQHGVIHPKHMHYYFSKADLKYTPYPDMTFLWGKHWADFLTKHSSYDSNSLNIVGQIRTDIIPRLLEEKKSDLLPTLSSDKKTILYPSQPLYVGEGEMRKRLASDFLQLSKDFPEAQFVIKPHPKEYDCEIFMAAIAQKVGTNNYQVLSGDLYKTLAASDLVVVYNSTVGAEAIYFSKPLLVMDYSDNDFSGFIASGIGNKVGNYEELKQQVSALLNGTLEVNEEAQKDFIEKRAHQIDGEVSQRIIKALKENSF